MAFVEAPRWITVGLMEGHDRTQMINSRIGALTEIRDSGHDEHQKAKRYASSTATPPKQMGRKATMTLDDWNRPLGSHESELVAEVRKAAAAADEHGRARLLEELVSAVYDAVKFDNPEGQGWDGKDGPERTSLGLVLDSAINHRDNI